MPNGEAFAKVTLAFLNDPRPSATDKAVYTAVVSALNHRTSAGTVSLDRICRRASLGRSAVSRSLQRIAGWGYWTLDRPPNGRYTFALAGTEAASEVASRGNRRRVPPTKDDDAGSVADSLEEYALPGIAPTADLLLASNGNRRGDQRESAPLPWDATSLRDSSREKTYGAGSTPNGAGASDPDAWIPGPDDPKLFDLEESTPRRPPLWWK